MKGIPNGRYTKEFWAEAAKLVTEGNMSAAMAALGGVMADFQFYGFIWRIGGRKPENCSAWK